jgi:hypothetical protein
MRYDWACVGLKAAPRCFALFKSIGGNRQTNESSDRRRDSCDNLAKVAGASARNMFLQTRQELLADVDVQVVPFDR